VLLVFLAFVVVLEIGLRIFVGLGSPLLFEKSDVFEYYVAPFQDVVRDGNRIVSYDFGLKSPSAGGVKSTILKIGDSVINGGERIGNEGLSSSLLEASIRQIDSNWQVQNVSCGSWGPENQFKFLQANPELSPDIVLYYISSHDLFDTIGRFSPVGVSVNYPDHNPPFALYEVLESFIVKRPFFPSDTLFMEKDNFGKEAFSRLLSLFVERTPKIHVFVHPTTSEISAGSYDARGQKIIEELGDRNISFTENLKLMKPSFYRDDIHLNEEGHKFLANQAYELILSRGWIE